MCFSLNSNSEQRRFKPFYHHRYSAFHNLKIDFHLICKFHSDCNGFSMRSSSVLLILLSNVLLHKSLFVTSPQTLNVKPSCNRKRPGPGNKAIQYLLPCIVQHTFALNHGHIYLSFPTKLSPPLERSVGSMEMRQFDDRLFFRLRAASRKICGCVQNDSDEQKEC